MFIKQQNFFKDLLTIRTTHTENQQLRSSKFFDILSFVNMTDVPTDGRAYELAIPINIIRAPQSKQNKK